MPYYGRKRKYTPKYKRKYTKRTYRKRSYAKKKSTRKGAYVDRSKRQRTKVRRILPLFKRKLAPVGALSIPLVYTNEFQVRSGFDDKGTTVGKSLLLRVNADHPGCRAQNFGGTTLPSLVHLHAFEENHTLVTPDAYGFTWDEQNPPLPGENSYMYGYEQFLGFPGMAAIPRYSKGIVTGAKLVVKVVPLSLQAGLVDETVWTRENDAGGNPVNIPEQREAFKSPRILVGHGLVGSSHRASPSIITHNAFLDGDSDFTVMRNNPGRKFLQGMVSPYNKPSEVQTVDKYGARAALGTIDLSGQDAHILQMTNGVDRRVDGTTHMWDIDGLESREFRVLIRPSDPTKTVPDCRIIMRLEMTIRCTDPAEAQLDHELARKHAAQAGATYAFQSDTLKRRRTMHDELS